MAALFSLVLLIAGWEPVTESDGISVERRQVSGYGTYEVRARTHVAFTPKQVFDVIWNHKEYGEFVPYLKKANILKDDGNDKLIYEQIKMPVISDRDYTVHITRDHDEGSGLYQVLFESAKDGIGPAENGDYVRVHRIKGSWTIEPGADGGADVTYVTVSDPGGTIPNWIVNTAQKDAAPNFVRAMMKRVAQKNPTRR